MSNLVSLPEEVLIIIIKLLDINSVHNLYKTCSRMKEVIIFYKIVKKCNMSCNRMASAHNLRISFFKDVASSIEELNLSCVNNLTKTALLPAMKRLRSLRVINVSYTNISIIDFLHIFNNCSTIIDLTIDSIFDKRNSRALQDVPKNILLKCQDVFKNFKRIHFIGSLFNLVYNNYTMFMLQKTNNIILQYTISSLHNVRYIMFDCNLIPIFFDKMCIVTQNVNHKLESFDDPYFPRQINKYEVILLTMSKAFVTTFYCTELFVDFFKENFDKDPSPFRTLCTQNPGYKTLFLFWNIETNVFDNDFFNKLLKQLQPYFVYHMHLNVNEQVPSQYERFYMKLEESLFQNLSSSNDVTVPSQKRNRIGQPNILLDYDNIFKDNDKIHLSMFFSFSSKQNPIALSPTCNFLSKLTYLCLTGSVQYSAGFFNVLFRCCFQLETFNYQDNCSMNYITYIARSIPLSKSLKNVRLVGKRIDHKILITFLSQCKSLENVHIAELSQENFENNNYQLLFQNCRNLYCLYLYAHVSDNKRNKQLITLNRGKLKYQQHHIAVKVINDDFFGELHNTPFACVFDI